MNLLQLPEGFELIKEIDLKKQKKLSVWLNILALLIALVMVFIGMLAGPGYFTVSVGKVITAAIASIAYIVLHEAVHGIFLYRFSGEKPEFGIKGTYAYAGNKRAFFDKKSYAVIALSPVVILGVVIAALNAFLPRDWFWCVYIVQILNISGAAGDFYVMLEALRMPSDTLINDKGMAMYFYSKNNK